MSSRVTRSVEYRINFGDYEGVTVKATIERDCELGHEESCLRRMEITLNDALDQQLTQARRLAPVDSFIQEWE